MNHSFGANVFFSLPRYDPHHEKELFAMITSSHIDMRYISNTSSSFGKIIFFSGKFDANHSVAKSTSLLITKNVSALDSFTASW